jgi:hypothetical protein
MHAAFARSLVASEEVVTYDIGIAIQPHSFRFPVLTLLLSRKQPHSFLLYICFLRRDGDVNGLACNTFILTLINMRVASCCASWCQRFGLDSSTHFSTTDGQFEYHGLPDQSAPCEHCKRAGRISECAHTFCWKN